MSLMLRNLGLNRFRGRSKTKRSTTLIGALLASYAAWSIAFRLLGLTFVIYFLTQTSGKTVLFEEVNETFGAHELSFVGFGALAFAFLFKGFSPAWGESHVGLFDWKEIQKHFLPGLLQGLLLASAIIGAFLLTGTYRYVGFFVQLEETPLAIFGIVVRAFSLMSFCYFEEWIFRKKIFDFALTDREDLFQRTLIKIGALSLVYCLIKLIQFELGWMHLLTLFLLSTLLSLRQLNDGNFSRGAGFWCGLLILFQPLLSLPILGNDFSGIFLVKYQEHSTALRLFTGGEGGPLSGFALQFLLLIEIVRSLNLYRKTLSPEASHSLG